MFAHTKETKGQTDPKPGKSYRAIYETLKEEILLGVLQPGDSLREVEVAQRFGSSRAPVREAFIHLFKEDFLSSTDYKGYSIKNISVQELKELFQVRLLVEPPAAEMAARNPACLLPNLAKLESYVAQQTKPITSDNRQEQLAAEIGFHALIAQSSGNAVLAGLVATLAERLQRYNAWLLNVNPNLTETVKWHRQILAEIRIGNPESARKAMTEHIEAGRTIWLERYFR